MMSHSSLQKSSDSFTSVHSSYSSHSVRFSHSFYLLSSHCLYSMIINICIIALLISTLKYNNNSSHSNNSGLIVAHAFRAPQIESPCGACKTVMGALTKRLLEVSEFNCLVTVELGTESMWISDLTLQ